MKTLWRLCALLAWSTTVMAGPDAYQVRAECVVRGAIVQAVAERAFRQVAKPIAMRDVTAEAAAANFEGRGFKALELRRYITEAIDSFYDGDSTQMMKFTNDEALSKFARGLGIKYVEECARESGSVLKYAILDWAGYHELR